MRTTREGFTILELMFVMVLGLLVMGAAVNTMVRQEQAYGQMRAMAGTQEDTRTGISFLAGELREMSSGGGDLLMADRDSIRFRALRKFGIACDDDKNGKRLIVAQRGADPFTTGDSIIVYADQDTLQAADDVWQREYVTGVSENASCSTLLGLKFGALFPEADVVSLTLAGNGLRFDSVFPGAPVRQFETVTYRTGTWDGEPMLMVRTGDGERAPLVGPLPASGALTFRYYDEYDAELTAVPLSATNRAAVRRIRVGLRAERNTNARTKVHRDSVFTDIFLRGG